MNYPLVAMYACFMFWAISTLIIMGWLTLKPQPMRGKMDWSNPLHVLMRFGVMAWFAMWCFRGLT